MTTTSLKMAFLVALLFSVYGLQITCVLAQEKSLVVDQIQSKNEDGSNDVPCKTFRDCSHLGCVAMCERNHCVCVGSI
ncbi:hypothetical protein HanIR_Chr11g0511311 [Helianthus annuus]|nr:hypothetical protein HanIR_Chr11g0511311 [Helianthus annuus]